MKSPPAVPVKSPPTATPRTSPPPCKPTGEAAPPAVPKPAAEPIIVQESEEVEESYFPFEVTRDKKADGTFEAMGLSVDWNTLPLRVATVNDEGAVGRRNTFIRSLGKWGSQGQQLIKLNLPGLVLSTSGAKAGNL